MSDTHAATERPADDAEPSLWSCLVGAIVAFNLVGIVGPIFLLLWALHPESEDAHWQLLAGISTVVLCTLVGIICGIVGYRESQRVARLRRAGVRGTAEVLRVSETKNLQGEDTLYDVVLRISAYGIEPFTVTRSVTAPATWKQALVSREPVALDFDPVTHDYALDWER